MSGYGPCYDVITPILQQHSQNQNAQYPVLLFSGPNCTGEMYPPIGSFNHWEQNLTAALVGFDTIRSVYVAPQAVLQMFSADGSGFYQLFGTQNTIIPDTKSQLASYTQPGCVDPEPRNCTFKVAGPYGWTFGQSFKTMRIHLPDTWNTYLYTLASNGNQLQINGNPMPLDYDMLFDNICPSKQYNCQCHAAYKEILALHADAAYSSFVNINQNGCNAQTMYVPSQANVGSGTEWECRLQINAQLKAGTFTTNPSYICGLQVYINTNGTSNATAKSTKKSSCSSKAQPETAAAAAGPINANTDEPAQSTPSYAYYIIGALLVAALLLLLMYKLRTSMQEVSKYLRKSKVRKVGSEVSEVPV